MFTFVLALLGIVFIIWSQQIGNAMYKIQRPAFRLLIPKLVDKPGFIRGYRWAAILMGLFLLLFAYANAFGPSSF
jgi:hypothetical protein